MNKLKWLVVVSVILNTFSVSSTGALSMPGGQVLGVATPAFVQSASNVAYSGTTVSTSFSGNVTAGNLIVVGTNGGSDLSNVTATCVTGNLTSLTVDAVNSHTYLAYGFANASGACSVTVNYSSGGSNEIVTHEVSGIALSSPLDVSSANVALYGSTSNPSSGSVTTGTSGDYIFAYVHNNNGVGVVSAGTGFTLRSNASGNTATYTEDQVQSSAGSISAIFNMSSANGNFAVGMMAFKPAVTGPPDTTAPSVPLSLSATTVSSSAINLSWSASTDSVGVTGYTIYRGGVQIATSATNSYSNTGLNASTAYTYTVDAFDAAGNHSAQSASANATTQSGPAPDTTPPTTPSNLSATAISSSAINLSWTASTDAVGVTGYKIFRNGSQIGTSASVNYTDTGLTASTNYSYTVSANDAAGNNSSQSASANAITQAQTQSGGAGNGSPLASGVIAPSRAADWGQAGIAGGIPSANWTQCGSTVAAYGSSGAPVSAAAINMAITNCGANQFVLLGAGDFYLNSSINLKSNVVLRGGGANTTKIHFANGGSYSCNGIASVSCIVGSNSYGGYCNVSQWPCPPGQWVPAVGGSANWTGGYTQGATTITLDNVSGIIPNLTPIVLDQCDTGFTGSLGVENCTGVAGAITAASVYPGGGGSGYAVNDTGTISPSNNFGRGYGSGTATYKVTSVSGGAVTGFTITNGGGGYTYTSTGYFGVATATTKTSGSGSGFQVNITGVSSYDNGSIFPCAITMICTRQSDSGTSRNARTQSETVIATSISGSGPYTVTLSRPLMNPNWASSQGPQAWWGNSTITNSGIENLMLDMSAISGGAAGAAIQTAYKVWLKGVTSNTANYMHVYAFVASNFVVRDSYFYWTTNQGTTSYGIGAASWVSSALIENNIIQGVVDPLVAAGNCTGCVFDYNFAVNDADWSTSAMFASSAFHSASTNYILQEGNIGAGVNLDNTHGPHFLNTFYRNYFNGYEANEGVMPTQITIPVIVGAFSRYNNFVGNVLGTAGYHNVYQCVPTSASQPICSVYGSFVGYTHIWDLGFSGDAQIDFNNIPPEPNDILTATSLLRWGNYDTVTGAARWNSSEVPSSDSNFPSPVPTTQSLPSSFVYSVKPSWWPAGTAWPPIGPDVASGNIGQCTSGTYKWSLALSASQCAGGTFSSTAVASHAVSIPAMNCYFNTMHGPPDGTGNVLSFNASLCYTSSGGGGGGDTTAPSAPTGLSATAISSSAITLSWTASTDNVGVTGYKIFRNGSQVGTSVSTSYGDTGLTANTSYSYTVSANDAAGNNSSQSQSSSATTFSGIPVPGDFNSDHIVNSLDYSLLNTNWFKSAGVSAYDLVVDNLINSLDFAVLKSNWGKVW